MTIISIPKELDLYFLGRNDYARMCGVVVTALHSSNSIHIEPVTSRGMVGRCSMEIPINQVGEFIDALRKAAEIQPAGEHEWALEVGDLIQKFGAWGEHPKWPRADWQREVANSNTQRGYWDYVAAQLDEEQAAASVAASTQRETVQRDF